ncbi:serine/threonine-protein kinase DCLK3 [Pholidichthys leucotaenia]
MHIQLSSNQGKDLPTAEIDSNNQVIPSPTVSSLKDPGRAVQPWPIHPRPAEHVRRSHFPPPHLPLFHTQHAEESAERPHLVTIVRPRGQNTLRKVTVLLNRRGVVSFEQLLLDISEALGFPRWHRARVTRLYTTHAREVKGVCDFFRGEMAFLALGKARPELSSVQEALEELFPEHSQYRSEALRTWEKRLRPAPDKAAKADSGYSEGTDSGGTNKEPNENTNADVKTHNHTSQRINIHQPENFKSDTLKSHKRNSCRKPVHLPNHLQRLHVRGGLRAQQPSVIGPFKQEDARRDVDMPSPTLCENCLAMRAKCHGPELINTLSGRVPLPPVSRKQKGSSHTEQKKLNDYHRPSFPQPLSRDEEKSLIQVELKNPAPDVGAILKDTQKRGAFELSSNGSKVPLSDIERCYEIGRVVGDGNFAVVRECRRRDNGQTLAIKIVERVKLIGREHMMQNELSLLGSLCHPRIVRLLAHHHTHTHSYLVMELVSGGDLFEAISEKGKFTEAEAGMMVSDVSEALNYIHSKSIVHRDLKPENLLIEKVTDDICRLKLGDFGLAMVVTEPIFTICGTPTYVAPEILCETGYGIAVDVWALGVILYILLCGFPPFRSRDRDQEELFHLIKQGQLHFPSPYWDPVSEEAKDLIRTLLQTDPTMRLTAEQTLLHPWTKVMASVCQQGVLTDRSQKTSAATGGKPETLQQPVGANATHSLTEKSSRQSASKGEITLKELVRHDEKRTEMITGKGQDVNKLPLQQSKEEKPVHNISPGIRECTPGQQKQDSISTEQHSRRDTKDHGPKPPNARGAELISISSPADQAELISQTNTKSKLNNIQQSPADSPPSVTAKQTAHQQSFSSPLHKQLEGD